jgi:hypothetical protein
MKPRHTHSLVAVAIAARAAAQGTNDLPETPNPSIRLSTCESLDCNPSNNSVCSPGLPGAPVGVGIAPQVIDVSSTNLSLTLIDGLEERGFTAYGIPGHEYTDLQLFVGVDPNLADDDYPSGCALMMQYQGQTFPGFGDSKDDQTDRSDSTSCEGFVDELCQAAISNMVRDFSNTPSPSEDDSKTDRCRELTRHINTRMREDSLMCGGHYISTLINVAGGALPRPDSQRATHDALGEGSCRPMLPQAFQMYPVARMRQFYFADPPESDFLGPLFGGRAGATPVLTVVYDGDNDTQPELRFVCMKTYQASGEKQPGMFEGVAPITITPQTAAMSVVALALGFAVMMM